MSLPMTPGFCVNKFSCTMLILYVSAVFPHNRTGEPPPGQKKIFFLLPKLRPNSHSFLYLENFILKLQNYKARNSNGNKNSVAHHDRMRVSDRSNAEF